MASVNLHDLERRREHELRLTPDRALETLDDAAEFSRDRGFLTLMPSSSLPSLFAACHEEPYAPDKSGFGQWPKTKYWWGVALAERPGIYSTRLHRGKGLFLTDETAALADPLCRDALAAAEAGEHGEDAAGVVELLRAGGPAMIDDLKTELGLDAKRLRAVRGRLERVGAIVAREVRVSTNGGHRHLSQLHRWDHVCEPGVGGGLGDLFVAAVRASVLAPEREAAGWFSWRVRPELVDELVADGRLNRPEAGWLTAS
jgi:hypothetical protein